MRPSTLNYHIDIGSFKGTDLSRYLNSWHTICCITFYSSLITSELLKKGGTSMAKFINYSNRITSQSSYFFLPFFGLQLLLVILLSPCISAAIEIKLSWEETNDPNLAGYRIFYYQQGQIGDFLNPAWEGTETSCIISGLEENITYCFIARSFDPFGNESGNSEEVCYKSHYNAGSTSVVLSEGFDSGPGGFTYLDDQFGSDNPSYASGNYDSSGGFSRGGLCVALGGIDSVFIGDGMSGGWSRDFVVPENGIATISLRYRLICTSNYESDECSQVLVAVDGNLVSPGTEEFLEEICDGGDSGWQQVMFDVNLTAGTHTLTIGGWNNKKTKYNEITDILFDDLEIR
jgi:hypothetical protein